MKVKDLNSTRIFYRQSFKILAIFVTLVALCRVTMGAAAVGLALYGVFSALSGRRGVALTCFVLMPALLVLNPLILPTKGLLAFSARIGMPVMTFGLMLAATRWRGGQSLPLGGMFLYLACATLSSVGGYMPMISFIKIGNFALFILGIIYGTRNLHHHPQDLYLLRCTFFAFAMFVILGSMATLAVPSIGYYVSTRHLVAQAVETAAINDFLQQQAEVGFNLFSGILNQSQALAPVVSCLAGWVACDMFIVEKRICRLHSLLLVLSPVILFLTRSRVGLLSFVVMVVMVVAYAMPKLHLSGHVKVRVQQAMILGVVLLFVAGFVIELRNHGMSRWIRKVDDVSADQRSVGQAFTDSRQGAIQESMRDFRRNPLLGMGFQVAWYTPIAYRNGWATLFSAPIEKGVFVTLILGEGGVLGAFAFLVFLFNFWYKCSIRRYVATVTLFVVYLTTNLAEGTLFSPGGIGGIMWMITFVGGFMVDLFAKGKADLQNMAFEMPPPMFFEPKRML